MFRLSRSVRVAAGGVAVAMAASLAGCGGDPGAAQSAAAVGSPQTCYRLPTGDPAHARVLSGGDNDLLTCAMHVEAWRLMNHARAVEGFYQGHYVYASADGGITSAETQQAPRFHLYTPGQQAQIDTEVGILISRQKAADGNTTGGDNTTGAT